VQRADAVLIRQVWRGLDLVLGIPARTLAAVAGTTVLAAAVSVRAGAANALVSAALIAVITTLNAAQRAQQAAALDDVSEALRQWHIVFGDAFPAGPSPAKLRLKRPA